jgi:hypothetical protein
MDSITIRRFLKNANNFVGVFPRDLIPNNITKRPVSLIVNTDTSDKPGEHWVAIYLNENGSGEYFDSYGLPPLFDEFYFFLNTTCPLGWAYNKITLQCLSCITCGHYCVLYLKLRNLGYSYCDFISLFSYDLNKNDEIVKSLNNSYFQIKS